MSAQGFHLFYDADHETVIRLLQAEYRRSLRFAIIKGIAFSVFIFAIAVMVIT